MHELNYFAAAILRSRGRADSRKSKDKKGFVHPDTPLNHVLCSKAFRKSWNKDVNDVGAVDGISLTYTEVGSSCVASGPARSLRRVRATVGTRNVPLHAEAAIGKGCTSRPGIATLDMHLLDRGSAQQFADSLQRTSASVSGKDKPGSVAAAQKDVDSTMQAMLSEGQRLQVADLEISSASEFHILIDGELVGPFNRVKIHPCVGKRGEPVHFPVSTFSPLLPCVTVHGHKGHRCACRGLHIS